MLNRLKKYAGVMTMAVASGIVAVPMMYADRVTTTQNQNATVDWLEGDQLKGTGNLSPKDQDAYLTQLKKHSYWKFIPKDIQQAIISNKENYNDRVLKKFIDSRRVHAYFDGNSKKIAFVTVVPTMWQHIDVINAPVQTPALNPKTGKPYVEVPKKLLQGLSHEDRDYIQKLTDLLNQNIHYLGNTPLPRIDVRRLKRGEYAMSAVLPLKLQSSKFVTYEYFMKNNNVTKEEQLKNFGIEDPVAFDLGQRFLLPMPDPRLTYPTGYTGSSMECTREPRGSHNLQTKYPCNPIFLGWSIYVDQPDELFKVYENYLRDSLETIRFFMTKINQEHAGVDKTTPRGKAESILLTQTEKITRQMQSVLEKEEKTAQKTYKKPPRTLLDPSGRAYDAFIRRHAPKRKHR